MFLFLRLLLGHFVGDFVLQFDEVYAARKKGFEGALAHYAIIFLSFLVFAYPYLHSHGVRLVLIVASLLHVIQDEIKINYVTSPKFNFVGFLLDQLLHLAALLPIMFFPIAFQAMPSKNYIMVMYNNNSLVIFCIGYIVLLFLGAYFWESFKISYFKKVPAFSPFWIKYGMAERFYIATSIISGFWVFLILPFLFRKFSKRLSFDSSLIFNFILGAIAGFFLRRFLPIF